MINKRFIHFTKRTLSVVLVLMLALSALAGCSHGKNDNINRVKITLPSADKAEQTMNVTAALSINYYLTARAYLDTFLSYNTENMSEESTGEFIDVLNRSITLFEDVEKLSQSLYNSVEVWEKTPDGEKPSYKLLANRDTSFGLGMTAYAAEESSAQKWAQDIVNAYDKAPAGRGIRTLAEQMGTDAKHAYAQLKQALAILDGAEYTAIAEQANTAVQVASGLKAAGTAAGLVIAVAAAPATTAVGAAVQTGGIVCSGINTVLEVGSAGSIIYNNGEDNEISIACDKTEAQFAPIGQVFSIVGVGQSLKDVGTTGKSIIENGYKALSEKDKQELGMNTFSILSSSGTALSDYANDGSLLSGTFTKTDKGVEFTLVDTLTGTDKTSEDNVETVLKEAGIDNKTIKTALEETAGPAPDGNIPNKIASNIIQRNTAITSADTSAVDSVVTNVNETLDNIENSPAEKSEGSKHEVPSFDEEISVPDDAFDGDYAEFKGKDGSVTRVFDNGSVSTKNADGTVTAVDYKGNQYSEDKDGSSTIRTTNGYVAMENPDGSTSVTEPNGKTTTMNKDGSFSEDYGVGITLDYNADGGLTGIGITGSDERIGTDENGNYKNGEITGPNGSKLTITDDGVKFVNTEGTEYDHTDIGNKQTTSIKWKDGSHAESETNVIWNGNEKTEGTNTTFTDSDGNRWDSNVNTTYDSNGEPKYVNNNVTEWTSTDGSKLWVDNNSKAAEYSDQDGNKMITDASGNLTEYKDSETSLYVTYDENGNVTSADITYSDGARMIKNADGSSVFTLPDGTKYESDGNGNVFKDGVQIKNAGEWVEQSPDENTEDETKPDETKTDESEPDESTPAETKQDEENGPEAPPPAKTGLLAERIAGTYSVTATDSWEDLEDSANSGSDTETQTITIKANSENSLTISLEGVSVTTNNYNSQTGTCAFVNDGITAYYTFTESGGTISFRMSYDHVEGTVRSYGSAKGTKK